MSPSCIVRRFKAQDKIEEVYSHLSVILLNQEKGQRGVTNEEY